QRERRRQVIAILTVFSVMVAVIVFWWLKLTGITVTGEAFCSFTEHTHNSSCYEYTLICTDESEEHEHTADCMEQTFICEKDEHVHTSECYSNPEADKETAADWESSFEKSELTASAKNNILYIASTQVGYSESEFNFETDENGVQHGYSRYGEWYGNPYGDWSAMFVSFCLNYADVEDSDLLQNSGAEAMRLQWTEEGLFEEAAFHTPEKGELVFLDTDADLSADTVGIVKDYTDGVITAIFGDWENAVSEVALTDVSLILGFGLTESLTVTLQEIPEETTEAVLEEETTETKAPETELTAEEKLERFEESLDESTKNDLNELSDEDRRLVVETMYMINNLPTLDEFYEELDRLYEADDMEGEEAYIKDTQNRMIVASVTYQGLDELQKYISNADKLFDLKNFYGTQQPTAYVTGTTSAINFNYINHTWNISNWDTSVITPIIVHGGSVSEKTGTSAVNRYWWGLVVEYDEENERYYVGEVYEAEGASSTSNAKILALEAETEKGFVILCWSADNSATSAQKAAYNIISTVEEGDYVTISYDPTKVSSGYNTSGYGNFYFTEPPDIEDIPLDGINELSDRQVEYAGGKISSPEGDVEISKTIDGTDIENVFDITLTVRTETNVQTYLSEPDMAVVIVMDISETMNTYYPKTQTTTSRYDAAMVAAKSFIRQFAEQGKGISKLGFVAFNTHAHEILPMSICTEDNVETLINTIETGTSTIINQAGYADLHTRFTNVEGGLKRGYDLLSSSGNENQYIVFLSDGFPTTYLKNGTTTYEGYDPYTGSGTKGNDGVFYDYVQGKYCTYGTSYSDKAAIKARTVATNIKSSGAKVFSIGIDIGGQKIKNYSDATLDASYSIVDRTSTTYEIGDASSAEAYKNWLQYSIGSGAETVTVQNESGESETLKISYYHDSTDQDSINSAFDNIFTAIGALNTQNRYTVWTSTDPLPIFDEKSSIVEFIHFYDLDEKPAEALSGILAPGAENTAYHKNGTIFWDLKSSGYTTREVTTGDTTTTYYYYSVSYRVRLYNEADKFIENTVYETNGNAYLKYRTIVNTNGVNEISEEKTLNYPRPSVYGYYAGFSFQKQSDLGDPLEGAEFTLYHDDEACSICHGNNNPVTTVNPLTYTSESDGKVEFTKIPSGHIYTLEETAAPEGFVDDGKIFKVSIAMDELSIIRYNTEEDAKNKVNGTVISTDIMVVTNLPFTYILPETGSVGTLPFTICGLCLMALPILYSVMKRRKERRLNR
ncbi:MAG: VWA domain-containing protein, partial [Clostridia bacterium]|nr:VWA domain-containing protein [Clostridia bacterium]